jgi:hypothetical protein
LTRRTLTDTLSLDTAGEFIARCGGSVRLIGDDQQLAAIGAGGVLRDIQTVHGADRLTEVHRFKDPAEAAASLALRDGQPEALGFYLDRQRIHVGDPTTTTEQLFAAWRADRDRGLDTIMLAPHRDRVSELNRRARSHRLNNTRASPEAELADGNQASAGDVIIARQNDRRIRISGTDWVKNGDRWTVLNVTKSGGLKVRHARHGRIVTLPPDYVATATQLGYASTVLQPGERLTDEPSPELRQTSGLGSDAADRSWRHQTERARANSGLLDDQPCYSLQSSHNVRRSPRIIATFAPVWPMLPNLWRSSVSQPPMPPGPPTHPQSWPQQGMQSPADPIVDPDGPATDATSTPTDGWTPPPWTAGPDAQAGWSPPPWTADPDAQAGSDTPTGWRLDGFQIVGLIVAALLLVGAVVGGNINASRSATGEPEVAPAEPTQVLSELPHDYTLRADLRVGDCFDLNDPTADQIEDVKAVPCTTEHEFEVFYVGAIGKGSYPTDAAGEHRNHGRQVIDIDGAFWTYLDQNCIPAFRAYIGKAWYGGSDLDIYWLVPTDDAWRSGDRTVQCAAFYPGIFRLTGSLRGTRQ